MLTDNTQNEVNQWLWSFGDGQTSTLQNPSHQFQDEGDFQVCLSATNDFGSDSTCQIFTVVNLFPIAAFGFEISDQGQVQFTDSSRNEITDWLWDFGDGSTAIDQNPMYTYTASDVYNACLTVSNTFASDSTCRSINVVVTNIENFYPGVQLRLSPNPFSDFLQLEILGNLPAATRLRAFIYDLNGRILKQENIQNQLSIGTEDWSKGMYLLEIRNEQGQRVGTYQILKQ